MPNNNQNQTELLYDREYFILAAEAAMFAYGSAMPFEKLAEAIGTETKYNDET